MCDWCKSGNTRIDPCMKPKLAVLQKEYKAKTLASCCGHKRYPWTIVIENNGKPFEYHSGLYIPRKKRFYKRDADGVFFIPEVAASYGGRETRREAVN